MLIHAAGQKYRRQYVASLQFSSNPRFGLLPASETHRAMGNKMYFQQVLSICSRGHGLRTSRRVIRQVHHRLSAGCASFQVTGR